MAKIIYKIEGGAGIINIIEDGNNIHIVSSVGQKKLPKERLEQELEILKELGFTVNKVEI